jgi:uncharacterized protein
MIIRRAKKQVEDALTRQAAVALIGPRQVGKTTLALQLGDSQKSLYLDLESSLDRSKLNDPVLFFSAFEDSLIILDEIHRVPDVFQELRGVIDKGRRVGKRNGRFLLLGSASMDLLRQSGESLAGRIEYVEMSPFDVLEAAHDYNSIKQLWVRGGFPDSFLSQSDVDSFTFRANFIRTYLERDVQQFGRQIPAQTLERLWIMLAHNQGTLLNASKLATNLSVSAPTITNYIDLLVDLLLVRRLQPFHVNTGKRLVKSPKTYIRDSGLVHALLGIADYNALAGHPVVGASWEGFVIENILAVVPLRTMPSFYRTSAGAEIDLILEISGQGLWAIEIKSGLSVNVSKGFHLARKDLKPARSFIVYSGEGRYPYCEGVEVIGLREIVTLIANL